MVDAPFQFEHFQQGVGKAFGPDVTKRFLESNQITALIRSHEVRPEGYSLEHDSLCSKICFGLVRLILS